jgi:ABC-type antimicrobial peptide transport system permease subunit
VISFSITGNLGGIFSFQDRFPEFKQILINAGFHTVVVPLQDEVVGDIKSTLYLLWGGVLFVLYGVRALNPVVLALVAGILAVVGIIACLIPARRAAQIDPVIALREE